MLAFTKWLYSSTLRRSLIHYADLWYFGRLIGCPEFQNAALKARQYQDWNVKDVEKLKGRGDDKLLSYILDHFAWSGMRAGVNADMNFVRTLRAREGLREVTQAAVNRIRNGEIQAAPRSDSYKVKVSSIFILFHLSKAMALIWTHSDKKLTAKRGARSREGGRLSC